MIEAGQHYIAQIDKDDKPHTILVVIGKDEMGDSWILSAEQAGQKPQSLTVRTQDLKEHLEKHWRLIFNSSDHVGIKSKRNRLDEIE